MIEPTPLADARQFQADASYSAWMAAHDRDNPSPFMDEALVLEARRFYQEEAAFWAALARERMGLEG